MCGELGTSAFVAHLIHLPSLNHHMWTGGGIELNSEVMDLKRVSLNNGVPQTKCHFKGCTSNEIQTDGNFSN